MGDWLTAAELRARYGTAQVDNRADRDRDGDAGKIATVIAAAIDDAEGRVKSELVANRFEPSDLPTTTATASKPLKRVCARLAWAYLWNAADVVPARVEKEESEGHAELRSLSKGPLSMLLAGDPPVDSARPRILKAAPDPNAPAPITETRLAGWGR